MTDSESNADERSLEQKALDDIDEVAALAEEAIAAEMRGDTGELSSTLHEIYDLARPWNDPEPTGADPDGTVDVATDEVETVDSELDDE